MSATILDEPRSGGAGRLAREDLWSGGLSALLVVLVESGLWVGIDHRLFGVATAIALHIVVIAAILAFAVLSRRRQGQLSPVLVLLALSTALLGPVGALGTLFTCAVRNLTNRDEGRFEDWYRALFPEEDEVDEVHSVEALAKNVIAGSGRVSIGPLLDVLSHGTRPQKQVVIGVFTRNFHPAFAPALRRALDDADSAIRMQAATSMAMIENDFLKRATTLERAMTEKPNDPDRIKALARHHDDYAHTGLLDPSRARHSRVVSLRSYLKYLRLNPGDSECRLAAARLFYHRGRYAIAAAWIERCIRDGVFTINMAPWYMDCLYKLRRYAELRRFAKQHSVELSRLDLFPVRVMETVRLWSSDGALETGPE